MKILLLLFGRRLEGTYYRAFPWAKGLVQKGHEVTLACTSRNSLLRQHQELDAGVRILETPALLDGRFLMARLSGLYGWSPLSILQRTLEIRRGQYDVVHTFEHHPHVSFPVYLAGRRHIPILVADGCDHYGKGGFREEAYSPYRLAAVYRWLGLPLRAWMDHLERDLRRRASAVTVISTYLQDRARSFGVSPDRIHLIPGGAELQAVFPVPQAEARARMNLPKDAKILAFLGAGQFDVAFSMEAFVQVLKQHPSALYLILGPKDDEVQKRAVQLGLGGHVRQTGFVPDADLPYWLGCANLCLIAMKDHPVNHARWPNKIGAYMAAGRPTVCTRVSDVAALVESKGIGKVSGLDPASFAAEVLSILNDPALEAAMGRRARQAAEAEFDMNQQVDQLERLYQSLRRAHHG